MVAIWVGTCVLFCTHFHTNQGWHQGGGVVDGMNGLVLGARFPMVCGWRRVGGELRCQLLEVICVCVVLNSLVF